MLSSLSTLLILSIFLIFVSGHPEHRDMARPREGRQCSSPCADCMLAAEATEGPYYWNNLFLRRNITEGKPGVPLRLYITVVEVSTCSPMQNAAVDIWHCDALGVYSHYVSGAVSASDTTTFLRGIQLADASGLAIIDTIFPGFYSGRTTHIHIKVHYGGATNDTSYLGGHVAHTGQLFFNDSMQDAIDALDPYVTHQVTRTSDEEDNIYVSSGGSSMVLSLQYVDISQSYAGGLVGYVTVGINSSATPAAVSTSGSGSGTPAVTAATGSASASSSSATSSSSSSPGSSSTSAASVFVPTLLALLFASIIALSINLSAFRC